MIALKKCVRQTVTVQLILFVESHGLIVDLHISSCLATGTVGKYCYEQNEISFLCIVGYILYVSLMLVFIVHFWGAKGAPILFSEIGFCMASCSYIYVCIYISVKMAAPWGSLNLLSYYSLCPHLCSH